jgi:arylsulfatase A-like enzyme
MERKNIIIIVVDALRPKNLSMFGYEKETDRNLKKIAKESFLFKKHFSTSNSTAPALTSIFTGLYPQTHGILHQFPYTKQEEIDKMEKQVRFWLPSYLKQKGYDTIAIDWIGMWFKKGFDYYEEKEEQESKLKKLMNVPIIKKFLLSLPNWTYKLGKKMVKARASTPFSPTKETINLGIDKIKQSKKPFFLFMHLWDTHFPFPNTKYKARERVSDVDKILKNIKSKSQREYVKKRITDINLYSMKDIVNKYDLTIKNIDKEIGRFVIFLKKSGLWQDTLFIFLGDHGTSLGEHNVYFSHSGLYDVSIHVPLIMHLPNMQGEVNAMVQNVDIVPTILDYLKLKVDEKFDGRSMLGLAREKKIRDKVFLVDGLSHNIEAVRTENRKLIIAKDSRCNLCKANHHQEKEEYNLKEDPEEKQNIYSGKSVLSKFLEKDL